MNPASTKIGRQSAKPSWYYQCNSANLAKSPERWAQKSTFRLRCRLPDLYLIQQLTNISVLSQTPPGLRFRYIKQHCGPSLSFHCHSSPFHCQLKALLKQTKCLANEQRHLGHSGLSIIPHAQWGTVKNRDGSEQELSKKRSQKEKNKKKTTTTHFHVISYRSGTTRS